MGCGWSWLWVGIFVYFFESPGKAIGFELEFEGDGVGGHGEDMDEDVAFADFVVVAEFGEFVVAAVPFDSGGFEFAGLFVEDGDDGDELIYFGFHRCTIDHYANEQLSTSQYGCRIMVWKLHLGNLKRRRRMLCYQCYMD